MPQDRAHIPYPPAPPGVGGPEADDSRSSSQAGTYFLGRYRVVDEIGVGGMASVHLARMDGPGGFQKWVAIKRIHPHLVEDETFVNMFLDEARVAARISHPNVATVFELGKHEDTYWIAMEYLHGEPLREVMRRTEEMRQPMPPEIACRAIADAAEGLHAAHELLGRNGEKLQLVHRDVTPHNLFVTYDGCTKVVDFGIAKFSSRMASTRAGTLKGKLAYMSPEQVSGETIDRRTDVFALGVVLWELTTGQRLFRTENDLDTLTKVQECVVPRPSTIVRGYPIDLEKIAMKALAKNKNDRYRTARELSRALQSLLMRRGLFIASDELAAYMASTFGDRIQKREAHLRWAAEVTATIDLDKIKPVGPSPWRARGEEGSIRTFNSEIQPSQPKTWKGGPRGAAGAASELAAGPGASGVPTPMAMPAARQSIDLEAKFQPDPSSSPMSTAPLPALLAAGSEVAPVDDCPTVANPRGALAALAKGESDEPRDTVVNEALPPEIEALRVQRNADATVRAIPRPPADSPGSIAIHSPPTSPPARQPTLPPMPAVMVPAQVMAPAQLAPARLPSGVDLGEQRAPQAGLNAHPAAMNLASDYASPPGFSPSGSLSAVDMERLFAPPLPNEQRTVTAQARRKPISIWVTIGASAVVGMLAFGLVLSLLTYTSTPHDPTAAGSQGAGASGSGPFVAARQQFAATVAAPQDNVAPAGSEAPPSEAEPIPTANVSSLPTAPTKAHPSRNAGATGPAPGVPAPRSRSTTGH